MSTFDDGFWWGVVFILAVILVLVILADATGTMPAFNKE